MKQTLKRLTAALLAVLMLAGCGAGASSAVSAPEAEPTPSPTPYVDVTGLPPLDSVEELADLLPADFGVLEEEYPTEYSTYKILEGDEWENTVHVLKGAEDGPSLYIVGGVHGDELAGWYAGTLLKKMTIKAGTVYIVAPANLYGAENNKRRTKEDRDLNRNFPGDPEGWDAERIGNAIYTDILDKGPVFVLDLHEGVYHDNDGHDNLGNSIICGDIAAIGDLVFHLIGMSQDGSLTTQPLDIYSAPPKGSLNQALTDNTDIPAITVETFRAEPLAARVRGQLRLAEQVLMWYDIR